MDFFTVPTLTFGVLYCFFVIAHDRRRILQCQVTSHPTSAWVIQQLRETFPYDSAPGYLIFDRGPQFDDEVIETVKSFGIQPRRTSFRSPWQNGVAERWVCTCRRDLLDHVIVLNRWHLKRLMNEFVLYYLEDRTHLALEKGTPAGREARETPLRRSRGDIHAKAWWSASSLQSCCLKLLRSTSLDRWKMTAGEACPFPGTFRFAVIQFWSAAIERPTRVECYRQSHHQFGESASFSSRIEFWRGTASGRIQMPNGEGLALPTRPSFPKHSALGAFALSFLRVANPEQLNHRVREVEAPICSALTGMPIRRFLPQTKPDKLVTFRSAWSGTHEEMVQLNAHVESLISLSRPDELHGRKVASIERNQFEQ
jgi:hypothetical protein